MEDVCYTREAALGIAIDMEAKSFDAYKNTYLRAKDRVAKDLLKDLALDELKHKYTLEKAFFEETVLLHESGEKEGPSMKFSLLFQEKPLKPNASEQEVMIHAIHEEKRAVDFYRNMAEQCGAAPMAAMFSRLAEDEEGHLARLEELYEARFMKDM
jgi:rubrerythrin